MKSYNGFEPAERTLGGKAQKRARENGHVFEEQCEMCGQTEGVINQHLEDYNRPLSDAHAICIPCHMALHGRFQNPKRWLFLIAEITRNAFQPAIYKSFPEYFAENPFWQSFPEVEPLKEEEKTEWWRRLEMVKVDFRSLPIEEQLKITHAPNPELDKNYSLEDQLNLSKGGMIQPRLL